MFLCIFLLWFIYDLFIFNYFDNLCFCWIVLENLKIEKIYLFIIKFWFGEVLNYVVGIIVIKLLILFIVKCIDFEDEGLLYNYSSLSDIVVYWINFVMSSGFLKLSCNIIVR